MGSRKPEQAEMDIRGAWAHDPVALLETKVRQR